jgi:EmrB/QacA subfamily drug resistance transporter
MSTHDSQASARSEGDDRAFDPALTRLAIVAIVGSFASLMDSTIVSVAMNTFAQTFHSPLSTVQWVFTGYLLALTMVIPLTGWAIEHFGAKAVWMASISMFLVGSVLSAMAWSDTSLIAFRVIQGLGGGMILPIAQSMLVQAAGPRRIGRVMAVLGMPAQLAPVIGPVVGGILVDRLSWRWLFYINIPICLVALALSLSYVPAGERRSGQKLDVIGTMLLSPSMACLVYGLSVVESSGKGFGSATALTWLGIGVVLLLLYIAHSLRPGVSAIIDVRLFKVRSFSAASALMFLYGVSLFGAMFLLPLYYTQARAQGTLAAGLLLAPQGAGAMFAMLFVGQVTDRIGPRPIILVGTLVASVGTLPYAFVGHHPNEILLGTALLVRGFGLGATIVPLNAAAYQGLGRGDVPRATGAINIILRIGASFGVAVLAIILQRQIAGHGAGEAGLSSAFGNTFAWTLILTTAALVPVLLLPGRPAQARSPQPVPVEESRAAK